LASFFNLFSLASGYYYYSLARVNYLYSLASGYCYYPLANGNNLFLWPVVIIFFSGQVYLLLSLGEEKGGGAGFTIISRCIRKKQCAPGVRQQALKKKAPLDCASRDFGFRSDNDRFSANASDNR